MPQDFWKRLDDLLATSRIVIDRPAGTVHPKYPDLIFPLDYGYLEGTSAGDGNEIDVWSGGAGHKILVAVACTVDVLKKDTEIKLIIGCTGEDIAVIEDFYNSDFMSAIIIRRKDA